MQGKSSQKFTLPSTKWLQFLIIIVLTLGVVFRCVNIDRKVYSSDEVRTFLRASGYTGEELVAQVFNGKIIYVGELQKYQHPNPEKKLNDSIRAFAGNPEHPPLYYLLARFWMQGFNTPLAARYLSVLISLLVFPCLYWLCLELFESPRTAWTAITLIAVSPLHILFAQEARQYSLFTVTTLLSSAALLYALKFPTQRSWLIYGTTVSLGIYSHLFFALVVFGQGIYVAIVESWRLSQKLIAYLFSSWVGLLSFSPWIAIVLINLDTLNNKTQWASSLKMSFLERAQVWNLNLSRVFLDFNYDFSPKNLILYFILSLVVYSIYFLCCHTSKRVWVFILILIGVTALAQILPDVTLGGRRSITPRYLIPCYLGIQLAVAYLLATKISLMSIHLWEKRLWQLVLLLLISVGILSCSVSAQARGWWTKSLASNNLQVAPIVNNATRPLVISDAFYPYILSLSSLLEAKVQLQLFAKPTLPESYDDFSDIFIYNSSQALKDKFETKQNYKVEVLVAEPERHRVWLYKLVKQ
jgi:uncharacterized membrane protein